MSSNHEHHDHDHHDHGHDHGGHDHDHSDESSPALQTLIYKQIEFDKIRTLNERDTDSGRRVVEKGWQDRLNAQPELVSDSDEQLLIYVPLVVYLPYFPLLPWSFFLFYFLLFSSLLFSSFRVYLQVYISYASNRKPTQKIMNIKEPPSSVDIGTHSRLSLVSPASSNSTPSSSVPRPRPRARPP